MKKQAILRFVIGAPAGVFIAQVVAIIVSLCIGGGDILPVAPALREQVGSELTACILQTLAVMVYGGVWAAASIVWELEWSLTRQTVVHFLCYSLSALPIATMLHWFPHTTWGFIGYFLGFAALYATMWLSQYMGMKARIKAMNAKLNQK